jgi:hypothetical protein
LTFGNRARAHSFDLPCDRIALIINCNHGDVVWPTTTRRSYVCPGRPSRLLFKRSSVISSDARLPVCNLDQWKAQSQMLPVSTWHPLGKVHDITKTSGNMYGPHCSLRDLTWGTTVSPPPRPRPRPTPTLKKKFLQGYAFPWASFENKIHVSLSQLRYSTVGMYL